MRASQPELLWGYGTEASHLCGVSDLASKRTTLLWWLQPAKLREVILGHHEGSNAEVISLTGHIGYTQPGARE